MGLLDEAIRDHLELKRQRGADPTEIARAEREALEPVFPGERAGAEPSAPEPAAEGQAAPAYGEAPAIAEGTPPEQAPAATGAEEPQAEAHAQPATDFSEISQETAELDMAAHMEQDAARGAEAPAASEEEPLEWEEPGGRAGEPPPEPIPGQERLSLD